jgi:hypothetical protein
LKVFFIKNRKKQPGLLAFTFETLPLTEEKQTDHKFVLNYKTVGQDRARSVKEKSLKERLEHINTPSLEVETKEIVAEPCEELEELSELE